MRSIVGLLFTLVLTSAAYSQDIPEELPPEPIRVQMNMVLPPEMGDITKNIHLVIDKSGSMSPTDLSVAIDQALLVAGQGVDSLNVAVTIFGRNSFRLQTDGEGTDIGPNWLSMPSGDNLAAIRGFLENSPNAFDTSHTALLPPLSLAVCEDVEDLSVIVISDCQFPGITTTLPTDIQALLKDKAVSVGFIGIGSRTDPGAHMVRLCTTIGAWYIVMTKEAPLKRP